MTEYSIVLYSSTPEVRAALLYRPIQATTASRTEKCCCCVASAEDESGDKLVSVQLDDEESWLNFIDVPGSEVCVPLNQGRNRDLLVGCSLQT